VNDRVRDILADLERVRQDLRAYSDDVWLGTDHNDSTALKKAYEFKLAYNAKMAEFDRVARELAALLQPEEGPPPQGMPQNGGGSGHMRGTLHSLGENFTHTQPAALQFFGARVHRQRTFAVQLRNA
jgi:hypothetical protein